MKNKIIAAVFLFAVMAALLLIPRSVNAAESESQTYTVFVDYNIDDGRRFRNTVSYTTDGNYYLIYVWEICSDRCSGGFVWYNPASGSYYDPVNSNLCPESVFLHSYTTVDYYDDGTVSEPLQYPTIMTGGSSIVSVNEVSMIPVIKVNCDLYGSDVKSYFHEKYTAGELETVAGYDYWNQTNRYNYESVYTSTVVAPEVRFAMTCWDNYLLDYVIDVKYLLPDLADNTGYYTELWADIPTGYDSNGKVAYKKILLDMIDVSTILKQNNVSVQNPNGSGWITENWGNYYHIYGTWSELIPYISANDSIQYGGIILYLRSSVPVSDIKTLVSDYVYFVINPGDVEKTDEGWIATNPDIYIGKHETFNEDAAGIKNESDKNIPNSSDLEYIGGVSNDPGNISGNTTNNGKWKYNFAGNWEVSDLENWVNTGFGLSGSNGLLGFIGNCFFYLPGEFMTILIFVIMVVAVVAIIKIVRGM